MYQPRLLGEPAVPRVLPWQQVSRVVIWSCLKRIAPTWVLRLGDDKRGRRLQIECLVIRQKHFIRCSPHSSCSLDDRFAPTGKPFITADQHGKMCFHKDALNMFPRFIWAPKEDVYIKNWKSFLSSLYRMRRSPKRWVSKAREKTSESTLMCDSEQTQWGLLTVRELMFPPPEGAADWCSCPRPHLRLNAKPVLLTPLVRMGNMAICQTEVSIIDRQIKKTSSSGSSTVLWGSFVRTNTSRRFTPEFVELLCEDIS